MTSTNRLRIALLFSVAASVLGCGDAFKRNIVFVGLTGTPLPESVSISAGDCSPIEPPPKEAKDKTASSVCDTKESNPVILVTCADRKLPPAKLQPYVEGDSNKFANFDKVCELSAQEIENENSRAIGRYSWGVRFPK